MKESFILFQTYKQGIKSRYSNSKWKAVLQKQTKRGIRRCTFEKEWGQEPLVEYQSLKWGSAFVIPVRKQQFNVRNHLRALFSRVMIEENETHKQTREAKWVTRRRFIVVRLNSETESCQCVQERVSVVIGFKCGDPHCVVTYLSFWKIVPLFLCLIFARITAVFPPPTSLSCDKLLEL